MSYQTYAGWQLQVWTQVGGSAPVNIRGIQRVTYKLVENIEAKEECGSRYPSYLVEGAYGLTGTLEKFYFGGQTWGLFAVGQAAVLPADIWICPSGSGSGYPYVKLQGVKFDDVEVSHRPMAAVMTETWTFIGTGSVVTGSMP